jgi:NADH-quinone oxidoreductase subunit E
MSIETRNGKTVIEAVQTAIEQYGSNRDELIPILNHINRSIGYLPAEALQEVSRSLHIPKSKLFSVTTFYRMLSTKPRGRNVIQFCESAPCHVVGGREIWQKLQDELNLSAGETTPDSKWSLITVSCLGICGVGPVIVINDDIYGNVTPAQVPEILARYS